MKKKNIKKVGFSIVKSLLIFIAVFGAMVSFEYWQIKQDKIKDFSNVSLYQSQEQKGGAFSGEFVKVLEETDQTKEMFVGDKFVVQDINLGGEVFTEHLVEDRNDAIILSHFQGRLYNSEEDEILNYYLSWQSNKPVLSKLRYKKEEDADYTELSEENFGYTHNFIFSEIDFSSIYEYKIISRDRWGNEMESDSFIFYTNSPEASFFELLESSFNDIFGWMVR